MKNETITCSKCHGSGKISCISDPWAKSQNDRIIYDVTCEKCKGTGEVIVDDGRDGKEVA